MSCLPAESRQWWHAPATLAVFCAGMLLARPAIALPYDVEDGQGAHAFNLPGISGEPIDLAALDGKLLLVVNTASQCGFTPQYEALQEIHETYKDRGLVVIGVPSNDFARQEPGSNSEIEEFTSTQFAVTFPLSAKQHVTGEAAHPLFQWIRKEGGFLAVPRWNFYKYLIGPNGEFISYFSSATKPNSTTIIDAIEANLPYGQTRIK